jgi:hypothetical protein
MSRAHVKGAGLPLIAGGGGHGQVAAAQRHHHIHVTGRPLAAAL